jgi:hypothetical protein
MVKLDNNAVFYKLQIARLVVKSGNVDCLSTAFWLLLTNVSTTTTRTTKQNLDPRCTYVPTRVKMGV